MNSLLRQLKIHGLMGDNIPTDGRVAHIHTFFAELFDGLQVSILPDYDKDCLIYHKGEVFYMEQDSKNGRLRCRYEGYWAYLRKDLRLNIEETKVVVKYMVKKHINQQVGTLDAIAWDKLQMVEKQLKNQVGRPILKGNIKKMEMEYNLEHQAGKIIPLFTWHVTAMKSHTNNI